VELEYCLTATRSARRTLDLEAPIDPSVIRDCLRIGLQAANGTNQQSWRWVAVNDPGLRRDIGALYRASYLQMTGGAMVSDLLPADEFGRMMSSTEWLVEHLSAVPLLVIPCYAPYLPAFEGDDEAFQSATLYGSLFPAVWNFQLALHARGYGTCITTTHLLRHADVASLLGIPTTYVQGCLLPVARLRAGTTFRPAPRRPIDEVVSLNGWDGPPL
jgi:nitroreductase